MEKRMQNLVNEQWSDSRYDLNSDFGALTRSCDSRRRILQLASLTTILGVFPSLSGAAAPKLGDKDALIVIDVQNCFIPGGSLAVKEGDLIVPVINKLAKQFSHVVVTQDWHTPDHVSFASQHQGKKPFDAVKLGYGNQVLWPDHCVQGTEGAQLHKDLNIPHAELVIRKGYRKGVDSYSAFKEADKRTSTGLGGYLRERGIRNVYLCGLATDFCVAWSALDARKQNFNVTVVDDACRGIDLNGSLASAWKDMTKAGVKKMNTSDFA